MNGRTFSFDRKARSAFLIVAFDFVAIVIKNNYTRLAAAGSAAAFIRVPET